MTTHSSAIRKFAGLVLSLAIIVQSFGPAFAANSASDASVRAGRSVNAAPRSLQEFGAPLDVPTETEEVKDVSFSSDDIERFTNLSPVKVEAIQETPATLHPVETIVKELREKGVDLSGRTSNGVVAEQIRAVANNAPAGTHLHALIAMADALMTTGGGSTAKAGAYFDNSKPVMAEDIKSIVTSDEFKALEKVAYPEESSELKKTESGWWTSVSKLFAPEKKQPTKEEQEAAKADALAKMEAMFGSANLSPFELKHEELRWNAPEEKLAVPDTIPADVNPIIGQERAIEAVRFAVRMPDNHHHLFVAGPAQSGAGDLVNYELRQFAPSQPTPFDRVLVTNFANPEKPLILDLPPGSAPEFKQTFETIIKSLRMALPVWLHHPETQQRRAEMESEVYGQLRQLVDQRFQPLVTQAHPEKILDKFRIKLDVVPGEKGPVVRVLPVIQTTVVTPENQEEFTASGRFNKDELGKFQKEARAAIKPILQQLQKLASAAYENEKNQFQAQETANLLMSGDPQTGFPSIHESLMQIVTAGHHSYEGDEAHQEFHAKTEAREKAFMERLAAIQVGRFGLKFAQIQRQPTREEMQQLLAKGGNPMEALMMAMQPRLTMVLTLNGAPYATIDGDPMSPELQEQVGQDGQLPAEIKAELDAAIAEARPIAEPLLAEFQAMISETEAEHAEIHRKAEEGLGPQELKAAHRAIKYLQGVVQALAAMHSSFLPQPEPDQGKTSFASLMQVMGRNADPADRFRVSILNSNNAKGAPVVNVPAHSTLEEVMGVIKAEIQETMSPIGMPVAMRTPGNVGIQSGYAQQAFGGHLVFEAWHLLTTPGLYAAVSEMVQTGVATIREGGIRRIFSEGRELKIPWKGQVTIVGSPWLRHIIGHFDPFFQKHFQVTAEMDSRIDVNDKTIQGFANFVRRQLELQKLEELQHEVRSQKDQYAPPAPFEEEKLVEPEPGAVATLFEHGMRRIERNDEITAEWGALRDVWREASHLAREAGHEQVTREDVNKAIDSREYRKSGYKERVLDMHAKDIMHLQLHGTQVGQTNALTIYGGLDGFGSGSRTTVTKALVGEAGVKDIENAVKWTDETYQKGSHSISARLTAMFAKDRFGNFRRFPFLLTSSKEQLYGGIGGDSSTSTKDYAGLSQLSEIGIQQSIAMTGSMSQFGDVQPIGGANLKIEGWYDFVVARLKLEGKELTKELGAGVIIPASNAKDLMLRKDIVKAVEEGRFHIWVVRRDTEGISILTKKAIGWIMYQADRMFDAGLVALKGGKDKSKE